MRLIDDEFCLGFVTGTLIGIVIIILIISSELYSMELVCEKENNVYDCVRAPIEYNPK